MQIKTLSRPPKARRLAMSKSRAPVKISAEMNLLLELGWVLLCLGSKADLEELV